MDSDYIAADTFQPLQVPGLHLPEGADDQVSGLDLVQLFIDDSALERLVKSTNDYADKNHTNDQTCIDLHPPHIRLLLDE